MFDFAPVGLGILVAGLGFLPFGWRLLPAGRGAQDSAQDAFQVDAYIVEATVPAFSPFVDKTVELLEALGEGAVSVMGILREGGRRYIPSGHWWIFADDVLVLQGDAHAVRELAQEARLEVVAHGKDARRDARSRADQRRGGCCYGRLAARWPHAFRPAAARPV